MRIVGALAPRLDPWRSEAARWWAGRSRRERTLLGALALLVAVAVMILLVRPLQTARAAAFAELRTDDALQARILAAGPAPAVPMARRSGDVATVVAAGAPSFGIVVHDVATVGRTTRLRVAPVGYDALIHWLTDLARTSDVRVERLVVSRAAPPGSVTADLVLSR